MFDHLKVDQQVIEKLFTNPEKDILKNLSPKTGNDFFAMLMEQIKYDDKQTEAGRGLIDNLNQPVRISNDEIRIENTYNENNPLRKDTDSLQQKNIVDETEEQSHKEIEKGKSSALKETNDKKKTNFSEEENNIILQLQSESSIKKLMELTKALLSGDKKSEDEISKKLFGNLKFNDKPHKDLTGSHIKVGAENNQKNSNEILGQLIKEFKDGINRELHKTIENRRSMGKQSDLTDKDLKDIISNVIEKIKKDRGKDTVRHESKHVSADDLKNDKKGVNPTEQQGYRKIEVSDSSPFEKNMGGDKNSHKENFNYSSSKTDFSAKTGSDKIANSMKMPDFKENLQEIIDKAKITVRDNRNAAFIVKLNPQELGNVNVNLIMKNGVITGKFLVDNEDVKNILLGNLQELKFQLKEAGIEVGEFNVGVDSRHERGLSNTRDETLISPVFFDPKRGNVTASEIYNSTAETDTGYINMII